MKTIDVRITFNCDDGSFEDRPQHARFGASDIHDAICRAYPLLRYSEVTVEELEPHWEDT